MKKLAATSLFAATLLAALAFAEFNPSMAAEAAVKIPAPTADLVTEAGAPQEVAVFAGGCFWGVQGVFQHTKGVIQAVSGYAGGAKHTAVYEIVGSGMTGHAEAVQITFDPKQISYAQLLQIYFSVVHDPTQLNRQGPDIGDEYRSAIFYFNDAQKTAAEQARDAARATLSQPVVTEITPSGPFYEAEPYHQKFAERTGIGMCHIPYEPI